MVDLLSGWHTGKIKEITIDNTKIDSNLTHFPVAIVLDSGEADVFTELGAADWKKIAVATEDGVELYVEKEQYNSTSQKALFHVSKSDFILSSTADTKLYFYYDSAHADNVTYVGEAGDTVCQNIYPANNKAVLNYAQDPSGGSNCVKDSTSNANHGTPQGTMTSGDLIDGSIGKAIDLDGTNDRIDIADTDDFYVGTDDFSLLIDLQRGRLLVQEIFCTQIPASGDNDASNLKLYVNSTNVLRYVQGYNSAATFFNLAPGLSISNTNRHIVYIIKDNNTVSIYLDNVAGATTLDATGMDFNNSTELLVLGSNGTSGVGYFKGNLSAFNFFKGHALSGAERKAFYNNRLNTLISDISDYGNVAEISAEIPMVTMEMFPPPNIIAEIPMVTFEATEASFHPAHAELNIPPMFLTMDSSQSETLDEFSMEIPSMTMAMNKAGDIAIEIPSMILLLEGKTNKIGNIKATIPSMTMQARTGANMEMELPPMFMDMDGSSGAVSVELTGDINFLIPAMRARITSVPDDVLETSIPMIEMAMEADQTGDNDLTLVIPPMVVSVDSGDIPSDELRYIRGLVR